MRIFTSQFSPPLFLGNPIIAHRRDKKRESKSETQRATTTKMHHDTATALAVLSLGTISISLAVYSSSSSNAANMSGGGGGGASIVFAKGMLVGSASTLAVLASSAYVAFKRITTTSSPDGSGGSEGKRTKEEGKGGGPLPEGEFGEKESLIGMRVKAHEMRGWLIFCAGSNASRTKGQYTTKAKGMERYYATLDVKTARMKLEVDRGSGGGGGGDKGAKTTLGANASTSEADVNSGKEEKFIDLKQCDVYLVEYPEGNKKELMWNHKRAILIARRSDSEGSSSSTTTSSLYDGEKVVWLYALSGPSKEAWFYALWRAMDMDSLRRGIPTTSSTNKQKFPEDAKSRIAQYLLENARFSRSSSNSSEQQQEEKKDEKNETKQQEKQKQNAFFGHIFDDKRCGQTVDIISSRIFFDLVRSIDFRNVLSNMLEKKLNELPGLPKYVGKFDVEKLALGEATPKCNMLRPLDGNEGSNAPWDGGSLPGRGVCAAVEADLSYVGLIEVTIRTRVDLAQYAKEIGNLVEGGGDPSSSAAVEEGNYDDGKKDDTSKSGSRTPTPPLSPTNSGRLKHKTKEEVTQNVLKEMKKVVENVNDRVLQKFPLKMTLRVSSCSGTFRFWIPPPPNERLWWGLKGRPRVDIFCEPAIGENRIAHEYIAKKVSHLLSSKLVSDICDELVLPNCASDPMKELIRFEHFVPEISLDDAIQLSEGNTLTTSPRKDDLSASKDVSPTHLRGEKKGDEHTELSKSDSENAFSAQLLPDAPKEQQEKRQLHKSISLKRENSAKKREEKNVMDATAEWVLSDSHFDSPPSSTMKAPSSSQPLSPKSPTGTTMVGFGNKREDVLRAKGGGSPTTTNPGKNHQTNLFVSLSRSIKQKADETKSKMKSDWQEVQKALQTDGVEGAVHNIKQIAFKRAKETTSGGGSANTDGP